MARRVVAGLAVVAAPSSAFAGIFAGKVVSYTPGNALADFQTPEAALGAPDGLTGENINASNYYGFPNILSPFSPPYQGDEIVQIGEGGSLRLQLSRYINVSGGKQQLGVFTNVGLVDADTVNFSGHTSNTSPVQTFGAKTAVVRVSADGQTWKNLGPVLFNIPTLYYVNGGPYDSDAPVNPELADFSKPFEGTLDSLKDLNFSDLVAKFISSTGGHSGGGTWLDLSGTGLSQVGYVEFSVPDDGNASTKNSFSVDAVSIANGSEGAFVPEPGSAVLVISMMGIGLGRRYRR